jgi:hypothetical protein
MLKVWIITTSKDPDLSRTPVHSNNSSIKNVH